MKKIIISLIVISLFLLFPKKSLAQTGGECPNPRNYCFCSGGADGCCDVEGPDGYNCGQTGGGGSGGCTGCGCWCACGFDDNNPEAPGCHVSCYVQPIPGSCQCAHSNRSPDGWCPWGYHLDSQWVDSGSCGSGGNGITNMSGSCCRTKCSNTGPDGEEECFCTSWHILVRNCVADNPQPNPCGCSATAPTGVSLTRTSAVSATVNWTAGTGGTGQSIYIGANKNEVEANCPGLASPSCVVKNEALNATQTSFATGNVLVAGTTYYIRVRNTGGANCAANSLTSTYLSSCILSPTSATINVGKTQVLTSSVNGSPEITQVTYSSGSPSVASASTPDTTSPYTTTVTGVSLGSSVITSNVYFGSTLACSNTANVTVTNPNPWWATIDSDVMAMGSLNDSVPSGGFLNYPGLGTYPGVGAYGTSTNLTNTTVSSLGWLVNSVAAPLTAYSYDYFLNKIPDTITFNSVGDTVAGSFFESGGVADGSGYYWYKYDGSLTGLPLNITSDMNVGNRKVILLSDSTNLNLSGKINLTDGSGFFLVISSGNINVNSSLTAPAGTPALEGLYFAGNQFKSGAGTSQLRIRGSVSGATGITLERNLVNNGTTPAEIFEYAADQILLFPSVLSDRRINWKEVAP